MADDRREGIGFVLGLLVGALVGASIAVILAPQSGAETLETIRSKAGDFRSKASDLISEVKDDANEWVLKGKRAMNHAITRSTEETASE